MKTEDIKKMAVAYQSVIDEAKVGLLAPAKEKKKLDPVGKADADIDNDGDVDKSDKYLHNRRKAIGKAMAKDKGTQDETQVQEFSKAKKENVNWPIYNKIMEKAGTRADHIKGATAPEDIDKENASAKKMRDGHKPNMDYADQEKQSHDDVSAAGRVTKKAPARNGDKQDGDKAVINPPVDVTKQGGMKEMYSGNNIKSIVDAYKSMYEKKTEEAADLDAKNVDKALRHDCATHVEHAEHGAGVCIPGQHTLEESADGEGYVTHYDVMFNIDDVPFVVENVDVKDLTIKKEMNHGHKKKK